MRRFFGDPEPIQRDYGVAEFREDWSGLPISASVHVQVGAAPGSEVAETAWLDRQADRTGLPGGIVAFADLRAEDVAAILDAHRRASGRLRGVRQIVSRHLAEDRSDEGLALLRDAGFRRGLRTLEASGLSFDLQLTAPLLKAAAETFALTPDLPVALCHAGSPWDRDPAALRAWRDGLEAIERLPRTVCKLSGLGMFDPEWDADTSLAPIVEGVLEVFGPERVMWGSNFPVDRLYRGYREAFTAVWDLVPAAARPSVFAGCASRFYRLGEGA